MAAAQVLNATHAVDDTGRVRGVADITLYCWHQSGRCRWPSSGHQQSNGRHRWCVVHLLFIIRKIVWLITRPDVKKAAVVMQQSADDVDQTKRPWSPNRIDARHTCSAILTVIQLRQDVRRWLSPDPSTNHNIARNAHHKGSTTWFFEGSTYEEWKITGSEFLLWIHGKCVPLFHSVAWHNLITSLICSWLRQEHTLVCILFPFYWSEIAESPVIF